MSSSTSLLPPLSLASQFGFSDETGATHASRTMMLHELQLLMAACPGNQPATAYTQAILEENVLMKSTRTTRKESIGRLRTLYGLDPAIPLFRALRDLWLTDKSAHPLLALTCALSRDAILRSSATTIVQLPIGAVATGEMIWQAVATGLPGRYGPKTMATISRNCLSSWTQSGHLQDRGKDKVRIRVQATPASVTYALVVGYITGARGSGLFDTLWTRLLDTSISELERLAFEASRCGWIDYRHSGDVIAIRFSPLLTSSEIEVLNTQP
ncbi:MAG: hypothetical protein M1546_10165 [Chloroflexi bacterium]|nr:hypothetical protein [Chloroflexota bacterium]